MCTLAPACTASVSKPWISSAKYGPDEAGEDQAERAVAAGGQRAAAVVGPVAVRLDGLQHPLAAFLGTWPVPLRDARDRRDGDAGQARRSRRTVMRLVLLNVVPLP